MSEAHGPSEYCRRAPPPGTDSCKAETATGPCVSEDQSWNRPGVRRDPRGEAKKA